MRISDWSSDVCSSDLRQLGKLKPISVDPAIEAQCFDCGPRGQPPIDAGLRVAAGATKRRSRAIRAPKKDMVMMLRQRDEDFRMSEARVRGFEIYESNLSCEGSFGGYFVVLAVARKVDFFGRSLRRQYRKCVEVAIPIR